MKNLGVAQLVARYLGVVEAARSSRVTQTNKIAYVSARIHRLFLFVLTQFQHSGEVVGQQQGCHTRPSSRQKRSRLNGVLF